MEMESWKLIAEIRRRNLRHARKGFYAMDATPELALLHLREEVDELSREPSSFEECADVLAVLLHFAQIQGWTLEQVDEAAVMKLRHRFEGLRKDVDG